MKQMILIIAALLVSMTVVAQQFDTYFVDRTLRLDYIFAGNNRDQQIYFEQAFHP